jgi:hypothetical protein
METSTKIYNRHFVYEACLLASAEGHDCMAFGNACDRTNRGEYKSEFYQTIARQYAEQVNALTHEECWNRYVNSPYFSIL